MPFGLGPTGFSLKSLDDILAAIRSRQQALFGAAFAAQLDTSVVGQLNGVFANELADLWLLGNSVWRSRFPQTAEGVSLDLIAQETGAVRLPAVPSTVAVTFNGTNGTVIPVGTVVAVTSSGAQFKTLVEGTISGGSVILETEALETGPTLAPAGSSTTLVSGLAGVTSVTNVLDADPGRVIESDSAFRARRNALLRQAGSSTVAAIRADVLAVEDVDEVYVFNNTSDSTDGDGLPPHSFEVVVRGGDDQEIAQAIFDSTPAGIDSVGSETEIVVDVLGNNQTVNFSRATEIEMIVDVTVVTNDDYPADGDDQVKQAIIDYWESSAQRIGKDVIVNAFYGAVYSVPGVAQVTLLQIYDSISPTTDPVYVVDAREIAVFDTSRISVTS